MRRIICILTSLLISVLLFSSCGSDTEDDIPYRVTGSMKLTYADKFSVDYLENGCSYVKIGDDQKFLVVPENVDIVDDISGVTVIRLPLDNIYSAASAVPDFFRELDCLDSISMTSTSCENWAVEEIKERVRDDEITYVGKYSAPDYEYILSEGCPLAIESTMIYHSPDTKEKLESLGIPVMVEISGYESDPLGRLEWIKLYGLLTGNTEKAEQFFNGKCAAITERDIGEKTVAFFSVNTSGGITVRKPGDYLSKMIGMAGGRYIFTADDLKVDDNALSTMTIQMETFYSKAVNADILIYNSTIEGNIYSVSQLTEKNPLFADFDAVKNGNVWCTNNNIYQQTTAIPDIIRELDMIINGDDSSQTEFLYRLT